MLDPATGVISGTPTGSPSNSILVIGVTDSFEFMSVQVLISLSLAATPIMIPTLQELVIFALIILIMLIGAHQLKSKHD
jgi:hypothetical protein